MRKLFPMFAAISISALAVCEGPSGDKDRPDAFGKLCVTLAAKADTDKTMTVAGSDGWLFFAGELEFLAGGRFWGEEAKKTSRSEYRDTVDPLAAIVDFRKQLEKSGIELIVVPVPPKAAVYADKLPVPAVSAAFTVSDSVRYDPALGEFHKVLTDNGVRSLDLLPAMLKARSGDASKGPLFCRTDTHWTPRGCSLAASAIAERIRTCRWYKRPEKDFIVSASASRPAEIIGDLIAGREGVKKESIDLICVGESGQRGGVVPVKPDSKSPVLIIGDSMCLVWNLFLAGEEKPSGEPIGSGLPDLLAFELQMPVDLIGAKGGGSVQVRNDLLRRMRADKDYLAGKKIVIWCFASRDLTQSSDGWPKINLGG